MSPETIRRRSNLDAAVQETLLRIPNHRLSQLAGWVLEHASVKLLELGPQQSKSKASRRATWEDPVRLKARLRLGIVKDDEQKPDSEKSDCVRLVGCVGLLPFNCYNLNAEASRDPAWVAISHYKNQ